MRSVSLLGFKADGEPHRLWQRLYLLEETEEQYVFISLFPTIIETNGRSWSNSEPTIYYCHKKHFYNVIVMFKVTGDLTYYVNIATPTVRLAEDSYGFIDLDLDVKLRADKTITVLDEDEFSANSKRYRYGDELIEISRRTVDLISQLMEDGKPPFDDAANRNLKEEFEQRRRLNRGRI